MLTNTYECLAITLRSLRIQFVSPFATFLLQCEASMTQVPYLQYIQIINSFLRNAHATYNNLVIYLYCPDLHYLHNLICPVMAAIIIFCHFVVYSSTIYIINWTTCYSSCLPSLSTVIMIVSHCGEYMANGLTNAIRHQFAMIAK